MMSLIILGANRNLIRELFAGVPGNLYNRCVARLPEAPRSSRSRPTNIPSWMSRKITRWHLANNIINLYRNAYPDNADFHRQHSCVELLSITNYLAASRDFEGYVDINVNDRVLRHATDPKTREQICECSEPHCKALYIEARYSDTICSTCYIRKKLPSRAKKATK
ncbi:hypothetical protein [Ferrimonas kyonanensis]|uniref:hypothetical protein n=1 Tax=Ferrimonas kyonanensis TaxID=364763 RepID=UPI000489C432|nr:hypothetical protein [Ferrimonas kyonanensis]